MRKSYKLLGLLLGAVLACGGMFGCQSNSTPSANEITVGSTYNTLKVLRDGTYPDLGKNLAISMAKGETEGAQLMVTPKRAVGAYNVTVSDLVGENGAKIDKSAVKVYVQKYLEVTNKTAKQTNTDYPIGFYPDMLLPVDLAVEYGENTIGAGHNQAFTVEVTTTAETQAGDYAGTVTVTLDGKTETVPLTVTVWDIDITKSYGRSAICWWPSALMWGELSYTPATYTEYYEKVLTEYRTNMAKLPYSHDPVKMAKAAEKYFSHPDFTTYTIPAVFTTSGKLNTGRFLDYMTELAKLSEPGKILLEKAFVNNIDEPRPAQYDQIVATRDAIYWCEEELISRLEEDGYFTQYDDAYKAEFCKAVRNIPIVIAVASTAVIDAIGADVDTYCAVIDQLDSERYREIYTAAAKETAANGHGGEKWYYTCVQPLYPYPTHHIDDALIGSRIMRWMQKAYDLDGYLYWSLGAFYALGDGWTWADPYSDPSRYNVGGNNNGDGYLVYPGAKYGQTAFLPSIRLTTLRDSQEDLNMLYELENLLSAYGADYGLGSDYFDMNDLMRDVYDRLFTGTRYEKSDAEFYACREQLAAIILQLKSDGKFVHKTTKNGAQATVELYLENGYTLSVDGQPLQPTATAGIGNKYIVTRTLDKATVLDVQVSKNGAVVATRKITVGDKTLALDLTSQSITVTDGSTVTSRENGITATLCAKGETLIDKMTFNPAITIPTALFADSYKNIGDVTFTVSNPTATDVTAHIRLQSGSRHVSLKENIIVPANGSVTFTMHGVGNNTIVSAADVNLQLYLDNVDTDSNLLPDRTLGITSILFTVKE